MDRIDGSNDLVDGCVPLDSFELLLAVQPSVPTYMRHFAP